VVRPQHALVKTHKKLYTQRKERNEEANEEGSQEGCCKEGRQEDGR
jgi:hypothetical protein